MQSNPERARIDAASRRAEHWRRWGPYLSDRQWGTVREDYSADGNAWDYFPFEMARVRAYRWGEDGILGICDNHQRLCFAPAFWNEQDEIIKERFFGLTNHEGNHGEDVKEYWWYLDALPSHAYLKAMYRYPQRAFPYARLRGENARRGRDDPEFELIDTGIFDDGRYWEITADYAKASPAGPPDSGHGPQRRPGSSRSVRSCSPAIPYMICSDRSLARPPAELVMNDTNSSASSEQAPMYSASIVRLESRIHEYR